MSFEKVKNYFDTLGLSERVIEFSQSSATVELAAKAAGCEPAMIVKTLSFMADTPILIACAGDMKIDNKKYKERFGMKAKMLTADEAAELIGHAVGGVCPFAVNDGVKIYIDRSVFRFSEVYPAAGSSNSAVRLSPEELLKYSGGEVCDVTKPMTI